MISMSKLKKTEELWDLAEKFTAKVCKVLKIKCWSTKNGVQYFTEEAQDIFNSIVDLLDNLTINNQQDDKDN